MACTLMVRPIQKFKTHYSFKLIKYFKKYQKYIFLYKGDLVLVDIFNETPVG